MHKRVITGWVPNGETEEQTIEFFIDGNEPYADEEDALDSTAAPSAKRVTVTIIVEHEEH